MNSRSILPRVVIGSNDYNRLMLTAMIARGLGRPHAEFLLSELRRATLCHQDDVPGEVVSLDSRVTYRVDDAPRPRTRLLVHPDDLVWPGAEIGATTPLGIALLGTRAGDRMRYRGRDRAHEVSVEAVGLGLHEAALQAAAPMWQPPRCKRPAYELH
ncbi:MAG TPA: GreA/GreB family elongation factor [Beijerinckiaceae bacterium]|jgi:regulator of nucleoside diphosphate kinase